VNFASPLPAAVHQTYSVALEPEVIVRSKPTWMKVLVFAVALCAAFSCGQPTQAAAELPKPAVDLPADKAGKPATAVLAGGCFWCTEAVFEQLAGVSEVVAGYAGGTKETADYQHYHESNHAEVIRITYDPAKISYGELLHVLFTVIDPTTFTKQWTVAIPYQDTGEDLFEYACHEGNYGMEGILSGAREEERAAAGKGK